MRFGRLGLVLAVTLITAACSTTGTAQLPTITSSFADPVADTAAAAPPTVYDITSVVTRRVDNTPFGSYDALQIEVTFNQPVVLQPAGSASGDAAGAQLTPEVPIDTDQNPSTGTNYGCGTLGFSMPGGDFWILSWEGAGRLANGNYPVHDVRTAFPGPVVGEATPSVSGNVLTLTVALSVLGNDDGQTRVGVFAGNENGGGIDVTDCAPNGGGMVITRDGKPVIGGQR